MKKGRGAAYVWDDELQRRREVFGEQERDPEDENCSKDGADLPHQGYDADIKDFVNTRRRWRCAVQNQASGSTKEPRQAHSHVNIRLSIYRVSYRYHICITWVSRRFHLVIVRIANAKCMLSTLLDSLIPTRYSGDMAVIPM
jgi:hypothetical protein